MTSQSGESIVTNVIWKFAERILAQGISLLVSVVLARILLPEDYGAISMVTVFITVANVLVTSGIPTALIHKKDADRLDFSSVFYFNIALSIFIYLVIFFCADSIASFYNTPILTPVLRVLGIGIIISSINSVQGAYIARKMIFKKYFFATLFGTLFSGVIGIIMAYCGYGVWALVAQSMTNGIVDTIILFFSLKWRPYWEFSFSRTVSLLRYGWKMLFEGVSNSVFGQLRNLIIGKVYTANDLAYYTKAQQFPNLIVNNISTSISSVLFPAMSNKQDNPEGVLTLLRKSVRISSYVVYPMLVGLAVVSRSFVSVVLTDKWMDTVPYLIVFCFLNMPTVGMIPRHQALNGTGRSDVFMNEHIISRIIGLVLLFLVYKISVFAIVISSIVSSIILSLIIAYTSKKYNGYQYKDQIADLTPILTGCILMAVPVYLISFLHLHSFVTLVLQIALGIVIYWEYSKYRKLEEYSFCLNYIKEVGRKLQRKEGKNR